MRDTFADRVRSAISELGAEDAEFDTGTLADRVGVQTYTDKKRVHSTLRDFRRSGEIESVRKGIYRCLKRRSIPIEKQRIMWEYFRMRKKNGASVTVEELQGVSDASADYVREFLRLLLKLGVVRDLGGGHYQLLKDSAGMPRNDEKAERLRRLRTRGRNALDAIHAARAAIDKAERLVMAICED